MSGDGVVLGSVATTISFIIYGLITMLLVAANIALWRYIFGKLK